MNSLTQLGQRKRLSNIWRALTFTSVLLNVCVWVNSARRERYYERREQLRNADSEVIRKHCENIDNKLAGFERQKRDIEKEFSDPDVGHAEAMKRLAPLLREIERDVEQGKKMHSAIQQKWAIMP